MLGQETEGCCDRAGVVSAQGKMATKLIPAIQAAPLTDNEETLPPERTQSVGFGLEREKGPAESSVSEKN